jgi:hypothetical protein
MIVHKFNGIQTKYLKKNSSFLRLIEIEPLDILPPGILSSQGFEGISRAASEQKGDE